MKKLPQTAGLAQLSTHPSNEYAEGAQRIKSSIILRPGKGAEFHPLLGGEQFLFFEGRRPNYQTGALYFGGTDEQPFLVSVRGQLKDVLERDGEQALFEALKPDFIKWSEEEFGHEHTRRQGDIFAYPVLSEDGEPVCMFDAFQETFFESHPYYGMQSMGESRRGWHSLFGTRHLLDGDIVEVVESPRHDPRNTRVVRLLATGTIHAPDHAPLVLDTPHMLAQAVNLAPHVPPSLID
ncbi:hypothetical protein EPO04_04195 [Patescibacteria group bacterium]|nr:MAG: hypothetical protein EPO04_04195 [Patescibacteria group bacterium]